MSEHSHLHATPRTLTGFGAPCNFALPPPSRCGHNLLLAHGKTGKLYREQYARQQGGKIAMALDGKYG